MFFSPPLRSCFHANLTAPSQAVTAGKREKVIFDVYWTVHHLDN